MNSPTARPGLVVVDFDDTIASENGSSISPAVASAVRRLARRAPLAVVTSRASEKAVATAERTLERAGLGKLPLLVRDRTKHGHSDAEIVEAKRIAILHHARMLGVPPVIGIGDRPSDEIAYRAVGMLVVRVCHEGRADQWIGDPDLEVPVRVGQLDRAWCDLPERVAGLSARR